MLLALLVLTALFVLLQSHREQAAAVGSRAVRSGFYMMAAHVARKKQRQRGRKADRRAQLKQQVMQASFRRENAAETASWSAGRVAAVEHLNEQLTQWRAACAEQIASNAQGADSGGPAHGFDTQDSRCVLCCCPSPCCSCCCC